MKATYYIDPTKAKVSYTAILEEFEHMGELRFSPVEAATYKSRKRLTHKQPGETYDFSDIDISKVLMKPCSTKT